MENEKKKTRYQSTWQDQLKDTANKILNREKFSYDLNGDALYKQYKDRYTQQGKQAMMDTMGQAQAMTGGYGNSYAQSVGQQTYQGYMQGLNDQVPQLYQIALDKYTREGDQMRDNMNLMLQQDDIAYGRYRDQLADQNTAYNKLMALMTGYNYEPTAEELEAAGMTTAQKNAVLKPYYDMLAAQEDYGGGSDAYVAPKDEEPQEPEEPVIDYYEQLRQSLSNAKGAVLTGSDRRNFYSEAAAAINSAYEDKKITEKQKKDLLNISGRK